MQSNLINYLKQNISTLDKRLERFTHDAMGKALPKRTAFSHIDSYIENFLNKKSKSNILIMTGCRGVGKTTLMAQICKKYKKKVEHIIFLSAEDVWNLFNQGIYDIIEAYEEIIGTTLENNKKPILFFLDEIQSDPKWSFTLKSLFEKTRNVFFFCTGSSAIILQTTPNLARRAIFEKLPPMSFSEYKTAKDNLTTPKGLNDTIKDAIYFSNNANEVYEKLQNVKNKVTRYWLKTDKFDIQEYLSYGSLPFAFMMPNESAVYDAISMLLDKIIKYDIADLENFDTKTLGLIKRILFTIAENDVTSFIKLEEKFGLSRHTITDIFNSLEKAEILIKIPPYGSNMSIAKKSSKYLFSSPLIRMSFFYFTGIANTYSVRQGKLLEDSVGSHLVNEFIAKGKGSIRYDSQEGGADFILQILNNKQIIIEVGYGKKDIKQITQSARKIKSDYNILFSDTDLTIDKQNNTVYIPLQYYFLM